MTADQSSQETNTESTETASDERPFQYLHSEDLPALLNRLASCLLLTTYQAGKLVSFRETDGRVSMLLRTFDKAMGLAVRRDCLAVATTWQIWYLQDSPEVAAKMKPEGRYDACFLPRRSHVTGGVDVHEIAWGRRSDKNDELWIVNTLFSCLCTLEDNSSFVPRWRPPFVSELRRHDRCHLNGLAMEDGVPAYVTAFGETDEPEGWRPGKVDGGVVIEVAGGETVARGLSMPHSPRLHDGRLWVLDSGRGRLCVVDRKTGQVDTVAALPGYTRGLTFAGRLAFVGLSQIRESAIFGGVPIAEQRDQRKCGVWIVDTQTGNTVAFLDFQKSVQEIFDVQLLPGVISPAIVGFKQDTIQRATVIAPEQPLPGGTVPPP